MTGKGLNFTARQSLHWQKYGSLLLVPEYFQLSLQQLPSVTPTTAMRHLDKSLSVDFQTVLGTQHPAKEEKAVHMLCFGHIISWETATNCWVHLILLCKRLVLQSPTPLEGCRGDWEDHKHQWKKHRKYSQLGKLRVLWICLIRFATSFKHPKCPPLPK